MEQATKEGENGKMQVSGEIYKVQISLRVRAYCLSRIICLLDMTDMTCQTSKNPKIQTSPT